MKASEPPPEVPKEEPKPEQPAEPPKKIPWQHWRSVSSVFGLESKVPNSATGQVRPYSAGSLHAMGGAPRVFQDKASWEAIESRFKNTKDKNGKPMSEVCRAYWEKKRRAS